MGTSRHARSDERELKICTIEPEDWRRARSLRMRALADAPEAFASTLEREASLTRQEWRARLTQSHWLVASCQGQDIGLAAGIVSDRAGALELVGMWVDPAARGSGVARELISCVASWAAAYGAHVLTLWVVESNAAAIAAYTRTGFERTGAREFIDGVDGNGVGGVAQIEMTRPVSQG